MVNFCSAFIACGAQANVSFVASEFSTFFFPFTKEYLKYIQTNYHQKLIFVSNNHLLWNKYQVPHMQSFRHKTNQWLI